MRLAPLRRAACLWTDDVTSWSWLSATREVWEDDGALECWSDGVAEEASWSWRSATGEVWEDDGVLECWSDGVVEVTSWSWRFAKREVWEDDGVLECWSDGIVEVTSWSWRSATREVWEDGVEATGVGLLGLAGTGDRLIGGGTLGASDMGFGSGRSSRGFSGKTARAAGAPGVAGSTLRVASAFFVRVSFSIASAWRLCPHAGQKPNDFFRCFWHRVHCCRVHA